MKRIYVLYLSLKEDGNVLFSSPYLSFNEAKQNIDSFLSEYFVRLGKKVQNVSKEELEKIKSEKNPEDCIFIRRKNSDATLYFRTTIPGRFYNSFTIERYGRVGINEFSFCEDTVEKEGSFSVQDKKVHSIEKKSHGVHVNLISELKNILEKRSSKNIEIEKSQAREEVMTNFINSLVERKKTLRQVTPPVTPPLERKTLIC